MNSKVHNSLAENITHIPSVFIEYLKSRGIEGDEAVQRFLHPILKDLPKPGLMKNLQLSARLVVDYMTARKQIIIWGDYDVDGTTGTSLLVNFFREFGIQARWHIPDRLKEGYGLNSEWFTSQTNTSLAEDFLLITVDCGISNGHEIEVIKRVGGSVIITDHHSLPKQALPDCLVLNPSQPSCGFHKEQLAGVGVAFYLAAGIRAELSSHSVLSDVASRLNLKRYLAFVALGTVADVVDLTTTNRILVRAGLEILLESQFIGLEALLESCEVTGDYIASEDIGYLIGPKINAAGRLGNSQIVVELLTAKDNKKAKRLAKELTELNTERRSISSENLETALTIVSAARVEHDKCIIVKGDLHQGVAGIVASRLVDMFKVPVFVFAKNKVADEQIYFTGSARSVAGVSIIDLLKKCSNWIERFGGHEMAAGLTVSEQNMNDFKKNFITLAVEAMKENKIKPKKQYDIICSVEQMMDKDHLNCFKLLEPFGPGNLQPVFKDSSVTIANTRAVGRDLEHLQVTIRGKYANLKGIGFSLGDRLNDIQKTPTRNMLYTPTMNRFRGNVSWQVRVIDI
ncbi:MAG: single-stranded-DNA-specific exonuclease RecJ [Desulfobulbaceae bacterium]|nr:single-stranded-DNA-specific exonuclease RecJ [Desulfobulbaceae bacterium]